MSKEKLVIALDIDDIKLAEEIIEEIKDNVGYFKINSLFTKYVQKAADMIKSKGCRIFLDLKFHDIPNTVANYAKIATEMEVDMFNVHTSGGLEMMKACSDAVKEKAEELGINKPIVLGVTVLTSIDQNALNSELKVNGTCEEQVVNLAKLAKKAGLDGVVASPKEIAAIRGACGKDFIILTPGIRPEWSQKNDQKRVMTPKEAVQQGVNYIVIGRPIVNAENRKEAAKKVLEELK